MVFKEIIQRMFGAQVTSEGQAVDGGYEMNVSEMDFGLTINV